MSSFAEMEWNGKWDWDDLVMFNSKASEGLKKLQVAEWEIEDGGEINGGDLAHGDSSWKSSMSASTDSSPKEGIKTSGFHFEAFGSSSGAIIKKMEPAKAELSGISSPLEASVVSVEPPTGLKLGFENSCPITNTKRPSSVVAVSSSATFKKTKSTSQNTSIPRCQVQGCNLDLSSAKDYYRKNRVCESHSKCPKVIVGGIERRFCQQCSRFHSLSEFDEKKRSCRRRLSDHNARRRKPRQETIQFHPAKLSSLFYDGRQQMNFALNNTKGAGNSTWESATRSMFTLTKDFPLKSEKTGQPSMSGVHLPYAISMHSNSSNSISACKGPSAKVFTQGTKETTFLSNLDSAPEFPRALSLLSTNSWDSYEPEAISHDHRLPANPTSISPPPVRHTIPQGLPLASSEYWQTEQQFTSPNFQNCSSNSGGLPQGIRLFKPHYLGVYSNALN